MNHKNRITMATGAAAAATVPSKLPANSLFLLLFFITVSSVFISAADVKAEESAIPIVPGLSWNFYDSTCPELESIIRNQLKKVFKKDIGQAAGLLRVHFHDCFVQGCDASVLLEGSASGPSEQDAPPNFSLRAEAFRIINDLLRRVHRKCGRTVSCADILALSARDSVFLSGGPDYAIPLGRRDGLNFATIEETLANLPPPTSNTTELLRSLGTKNFTATDVVALSGGHTIGLGTCRLFDNRIYPTRDPTMDQTFFKNLRRICPVRNSTNTTVLDIRSPNVFDNKYYVDLINRQTLFTSDQDLYTDRRTRPIVTSFAVDQSLFFKEFVKSMIKMSQLNVLTGSQGEIRANCSVRNVARSTPLGSVVEEAAEIGFSLF